MQSPQETDELTELRSRVSALEARLDACFPPEIDTLYTDDDIEIFWENLINIKTILADEQFLDRASNLIETIEEETYDRLFDYVRSTYPRCVINICDSCNGLLFISEKSYDPEIFTWNIGGRPEILMSLISKSYHCTRELPFFKDLLNQGFGYSKRTRFIDKYQTDFTEYHFVSKHVVINNRIVFIVVSEKH
jgi:hypothetical protein